MTSSNGQVEKISPANLGVTSMRASKENFEAPTEEVMTWLKNAEVKFYNYIEDKNKIKHAGVMADDFSKLGLGASDKQNSIADMIGVLYMIVKEQQREIKGLKSLLNSSKE